ncbi:hypothetical protein [Lederbergia lenta]|uniref:hypothetical protein n=1 Tax=Lederbergia lenta TaxID=1467 RepID=UPI00203B9C70|nr:hypothetical protein [Lederbergia lenta]MCM3109869.1 hypothetical protein [Lederbergia lenta]
MYARKNFCVEVTRATEKTELITEYGSTWAREGQLIAKNLDGHLFVISDDELEQQYVSVARVEEAKRGKEDIDSIAEAYAQSWVGNEDDEYINGTLAMNEDKW